MKPVTILEVPPLILIGIRIYNEDEYGKYVVGEILSPNFNQYLGRKLNVPNLDKYDSKKLKEKLENNLDNSSEIRGIFQSQPHLSSIPRKKPDIIEIKLNSIRAEVSLQEDPGSTRPAGRTIMKKPYLPQEE
jgi:large subunit ribosomal protein L3